MKINVLLKKHGKLLFLFFAETQTIGHITSQHYFVEIHCSVTSPFQL